MLKLWSSNPNTNRNSSMTRRARMEDIPSESHSELLNKIRDAGIFMCYYCRIMYSFDDLHLDHKTPIAREGTDLNDNIVPACQNCNQSKGSQTAEEFDPYANYI